MLSELLSECGTGRMLRSTTSGGLGPLLNPQINYGAGGEGVGRSGAVVFARRVVGVLVELDRGGVAGLAARVIVGHAVGLRGSLLPAKKNGVRYGRRLGT